MKTTDTPIPTPFTAIYTQWLESFRALIPGNKKVTAAEKMTPKEALKQAKQDWEDEGGSCKPPAAEAGVEPAPKLPL